MLALWLPYRLALVLAGVFALSFVAQGVKICVDTVVQRTVDDSFRGRVFAVYDTLFNVAFVGGRGRHRAGRARVRARTGARSSCSRSATP